jgi:hypothetical protein
MGRKPLAGFVRDARCVGLTLATLLVSPTALTAGPGLPPGPVSPIEHQRDHEPPHGFPRHDPLVAMVRRVDRFLWRHSVGGVAFDSRYALDPTEVARLSATCQLLGYAELHRAVPRRRFRVTVGQCADTLLGRFAEVRSGTVFDGMLGYAMLEAYETIGDPRYLAAAEEVIAELKAIPRTEYILNGGLMAAMAFAEHHRLTGDTDSEALARLVLAGEPAFQHADGSFPHWCRCTRDISYTDWMSMELILIQRAMDDPHIAPMLAGTLAFMEGRIDEQGHTHYEGPCPGDPGCVVEYYSRGSGCSIDTETRAFTNEPAYSALLFDHFRSPRYAPVLRFLHSIESNGTWADQWDYFVPPSDPYYPWASADTSVINISINFWALAATLSGREDRRAIALEWARDDADESFSEDADPAKPRFAPAGFPRPRAGALPGVNRLQIASSEVAATCDSPPAIAPAAPRPPMALAFSAITPNPSRAGFEIRFTLSAAGPVSLSIYDPAGRRVRALPAEELEPGAHSVRWDGRDDAGRTCGGGIYFAALRHADELRVARLLLR